MRTVALPGGETVPALGQGTWYMGERRGEAAKEADALRLGVDLGMTLLDTAEMYASGGAEQVVAQAVRGIRDRVFIVSKVLPQNASLAGTVAACERSLKRLATDRIDLYLLHWRGGHPLAETVGAFQALKAAGKIRYWGVSNLDTADMEELVAVPGGSACAANQVLYHPDSRGIEFDLLPWCAAHAIPVMAYSPLGHHVRRLLGSSALQAVAARHGATPAQIAIAWGMRAGQVISIPKAADLAHVRENAAAGEITLTAEDLTAIDAAHRPPSRKVGLDLL
ncbi:aldo/keto reductase [Acidisphaera sp. S103]|uniref:aldo/keto reductase n=1 Tax=Acidisphaera sp. S103 TaxID=1747223 RepID=UPI00131E421B|nr:aldo/keto reductase [Acidisphaera sp. S103]